MRSLDWKAQEPEVTINWAEGTLATVLGQRRGARRASRVLEAGEAWRLTGSRASVAQRRTRCPFRQRPCERRASGPPRTLSDDVRREGGFKLSHADSVGRCQVESGYRVGLQAGGHRFDPGTLHLRLDAASRLRNWRRRTWCRGGAEPAATDSGRRSALRSRRRDRTV